MSACPVCSTYPVEVEGRIDRAGDIHRKEMARLRQREAEGRVYWPASLDERDAVVARFGGLFGAPS